MNKEVTVCHCNQCNADWLPRTLFEPNRCPHCQSRKWNKPGPYSKPDPRTEEEKADLKAMRIGKCHPPSIIPLEEIKEARNGSK